MSGPGASEMSAAAPVVSLAGVGKTYAAGKGSFVALAGIDLDILPGQVTALMGPSGSGKTTLLSIIGCILRPSRGEVRLFGEEVSELAEARRNEVRLARIGFVFQGYNLFPTLNARQNVELVLELKGTRRAERRHQAMNLLDAVGLLDKSESYPADLSGGQKQRVAVARALAGEPGLVLADEPTAALDLDSGRRVMGLFRHLARNARRGVVVVTHDSRILDLADRVVQLEDGRIAGDEGRAERRAEGPASLTGALLRRPRSFDIAIEEAAAP